ncbi:MAG: transposase [Granulosicoccus sp.]
MIPKYRRKTLYKELRSHLGSVFRELARRKECDMRRMQVDDIHHSQVA